MLAPSAPSLSRCACARAAAARDGQHGAPACLNRPRRRGLPQAVAAPAPSTKNPAAFIPKNLHGFEALRSEYIAEYDAVAILYKHKKTGAEVGETVTVGATCEP